MTLTERQEVELRRLAEDLAELYDITVEDALARIKRTLVGDVEPVRIVGP